MRLLANSALWIGLALTSLILFTGFLYYPGTQGSFLLDDTHNLAASSIEEFKINELIGASFSNTSGPLKRPLSAFSFAITYGLHGATPWGYKWHNILIHLGIGLWVFLVSHRLLNAAGIQNTQRYWAALALCAFWLLHPLQVSTVLYAVQRMAQLSAFFMLAAIWCYLKVRQDQLPIHHQQRLLFIAFPTLALAGIFSKENAFSLLFFILLIEAVFFQFNTRKDTHQTAKNLMYFWGLIIITPIFIGILYLFSHPSYLNYDFRTFTLAQRLLTQPHVLLDYWAMIITPNLQNMGLFHDDITVIKSLDTKTLIAITTHVSLIIIAVLLRRYPLIPFAIGWFYLSHLVESSIFPLELMFEHRNYLSILSGGMLLFFFIFRYLSPFTITIATLSIVSILTLQTHNRVTHWSSSETFYRYNVANHPRSLRANIGYANFLITQKDYPSAIYFIKQANRHHPDNAGPMLHLLRISCTGGIQFKPDFYTKLQSKLTQYGTTSYSQNLLHNISQQIMLGKCTKTITPEHFLQVLEALSTNVATVKHTSRKAELAILKARVHSLSNIKQTHKLYQYAFQLSPSAKLLVEHAAVLIYFNQPALALRVIEKLQDTFSPFTTRERRQFNDLFIWYKQHTTPGDTL